MHEENEFQLRHLYKLSKKIILNLNHSKYKKLCITQNELHNFLTKFLYLPKKVNLSKQSIETNESIVK